MGKLNSIFTFTGKVDQAVGMKGQNGETYVRKNVVPKNPNTTAQVAQRVKMALAGLISKMTPKSAIYGMGNSDVMRRSNFTSNIARKATVTTTNGVAQAVLAPADLIFSDGVNRDLSSLLTASLVSDVLTVTASALPDDIPAVIVIAAYAQTEDGPYTAIEALTITATSLTATFPARRAAQANVYYIPVMQSEGASRASYERAVANIAASDSYAAQAEALTSGVFNYAASNLLGTITPGA